MEASLLPGSAGESSGAQQPRSHDFCSSDRIGLGDTCCFILCTLTPQHRRAKYPAAKASALEPEGCEAKESIIAGARARRCSRILA